MSRFEHLREVLDEVNKMVEESQAGGMWHSKNDHKLATSVPVLLDLIEGYQAYCKGPFAKNAADDLADEVDVLIARKVIDSRSPAADALIDYRTFPQAPRTERSKRISDLERELDKLQLVCDRRWRDRYDALNVKTKEGLTCSEWLLRTGIAERERDEAKTKLERVTAARDRLAQLIDLRYQEDPDARRREEVEIEQLRNVQ